MKILIRKATKKDLSQVRTFQGQLDKARQKLWKKSRAFHDRTKPSRLITKISARGILLVAENDHQLVGFVYGEISKRPNHKLAKLGDVEELFVLADFRQRGVSIKLMKALIKEFKKKGCDHIITHTDSENEPAQALYKTIGMAPVTVELWKKI